MNIALIGAPGAGKTALGYRLARELEVYDPTCRCGERTVKLVDLYVPEIEKEADIGLGPIADYIGNLYVALGRYGRERVARASHNVVITCGTLIETAVYTALHFVSLMEVSDEVSKAEAAPRIESTLRMMACLYTDIMSYDYAFYLPPKQQDEAVETAYFDQQLQAALGGFKLLPVTPLMIPETQLEDALAALGKVADEVGS